VRVRSRGTSQGAVLEVTDSGPGIPAPDRERVFDRFYRRAGTASEGSGLGLAIVKAIADRHGAEVGIDGAPQGGLEVTVAFPRRP
jgi:two-component system, OmpR family, sensor kinase